MKIRLLPSTFGSDGSASQRQHYSCIVINGCVAIDAGSLASGVTDDERAKIRDVILTHAHLDHIAGLPLFIDDLFPTLTDAVRIHALPEVIEALESDIFNWRIYPRFSEIENQYGKVIAYQNITHGKSFSVCGLLITPLTVNHKVPSCGFVISDESSTIAITGDTAEMDQFWSEIAKLERLNAVLIECAFPDEFDRLASVAHHLTPSRLASELAKKRPRGVPVWVINIKPMYREKVISQLNALAIEGLGILEVGSEYQF